MPSPTTGPESCQWVGVHLAGHGSTGDCGSENRREALSLSRLQMDREVGGGRSPGGGHSCDLVQERSRADVGKAVHSQACWPWLPGCRLCCVSEDGLMELGAGSQDRWQVSSGPGNSLGGTGWTLDSCSRQMVGSRGLSQSQRTVTHPPVQCRSPSSWGSVTPGLA